MNQKKNQIFNSGSITFSMYMYKGMSGFKVSLNFENQQNNFSDLCGGTFTVTSYMYNMRSDRSIFLYMCHGFKQMSFVCRSVKNQSLTHSCF